MVSQWTNAIVHLMENPGLFHRPGTSVCDHTGRYLESAVALDVSTAPRFRMKTMIYAQPSPRHAVRHNPCNLLRRVIAAGPGARVRLAIDGSERWQAVISGGEFHHAY